MTVRVLTRGLLLVLTLLVLVVPTVQLMSVISPSATHQVSSKTLGKTSTASRIPAVVTTLPGLGREGVATRTATAEPSHVRTDFATAPFVPPRAERSPLP